MISPHRKFRFSVLFMLVLLVLTHPAAALSGTGMSDGSKAGGAKQMPGTYPAMPGPGKKVPIGGGFYLIYGFDKKPKLGTMIMKVEIFTAAGQKDISCAVKADAGMPSMKGAHETGDRPFQLSRKGDYLLPITLVMPGDWEIRLTVSKGGDPLFRGRYNFDL